VWGRRIPIAMNVMTLFEQTDRALTLSANQFAGRSLVFDKLVNDIVYLPLPNSGVFLAAFGGCGSRPTKLLCVLSAATLSLHF
jgi:hypothetical protein